jgi:hypothetical protein
VRHRAASTPKSKRSSPPRNYTRKSEIETSWIEALAAPYLRGYRPLRVSRGSLRGYRFAAPPPRGEKSRAGFFVGYILKPGNLEFLGVTPPECAVFAFVGPASSAFHREMVTEQGSLLRKTAEYIGWLTHRPPRFAFFEDKEVALARHFSMTAWPKAKHQHYSRNFFIETLAWLVRSGLVAKLRGGESLSAAGSR